MKDNFVEINNIELEDVNGGLPIIPIVIVGTLVVDKIVENTSGKDIIQWVGTGLSAAGEGLQNLGNALMN